MSDSVHPYGSFWLDVIDKAVKAFAVAIAGAWAYWNHNQKRTFAERLQPTISAEKLSGIETIKIVVRAENIGNSLVTLGRVRVCRIVQINSLLEEIQIDTHEVFQDEEVLESAEYVETAILKNQLNPATTLVNVQFVIDATRKRPFRSQKEFRWKATSVLNLDEVIK